MPSPLSRILLIRSVCRIPTLCRSSVELTSSTFSQITSISALVVRPWFQENGARWRPICWRRWRGVMAAWEAGLDSISIVVVTALSHKYSWKTNKYSLPQKYRTAKSFETWIRELLWFYICQICPVAIVISVSTYCDAFLVSQGPHF